MPVAVAVLDTFMPAQLGRRGVPGGRPGRAARLGLWPGLVTCALSSLAFNFFFLPPRYTFVISSSGDWLTLALYAVTAVVTSGLAARARDQAAVAERRAHESELALRFATMVARSPELEPALRDSARRGRRGARRPGRRDRARRDAGRPARDPAVRR